MVNKESQAGRDFVLFKRQLYQMYEVKHRSVWEHEAFSLAVERHNLKWLHDANRDFLMEIQRINYLDQQADFTRLSESVIFKKKLLNEDKVKGLAAWVASAYTYSKLTALTLMMGKFLPSAAITYGVMYGMMKWNDVNVVHQVEVLPCGNYKITYNTSMFQSHEVVCNAKDTWALCHLDENNGVNGDALNINRYI